MTVTDTVAAQQWLVDFARASESSDTLNPGRKNDIATL